MANLRPDPGAMTVGAIRAATATVFVAVPLVWGRAVPVLVVMIVPGAHSGYP